MTDVPRPYIVGADPLDPRTQEEQSIMERAARDWEGDAEIQDHIRGFGCRRPSEEERHRLGLDDNRTEAERKILRECSQMFLTWAYEALAFTSDGKVRARDKDRASHLRYVAAMVEDFGRVTDEMRAERGREREDAPKR